MRVSTRGRYALRLMLDLAMNNTGEPVRLKDVAKRQEISEKYLEQIISILNKAGFVKSVRGPAGGYSLKRKPEEYTVGMILRLTEGSLAPVDCVEDGTDCGRGGEEQKRRFPHEAQLLRRRPVRHRSALEETERRHQRRRGQHHPGRPRGLADAEGE